MLSDYISGNRFLNERELSQQSAVIATIEGRIRIINSACTAERIESRKYKQMNTHFELLKIRTVMLIDTNGNI